MRPSPQALERLLGMVALITALVVGGNLLTGARWATADGLATVKSCDANASSSTDVDCTIVLNNSIDPGGSWSATITDMAAVVTACDGSAAQATCKASSNTAEFDCPSGCAQNSTYKITVTASSATAMQQTYTVLYAGTPAGGANSGPSAGSITVGLGGAGGSTPQGAGNYSAVSPGPAPTYRVPQQAVSSSGPQGGACVGGSFPGPNGCTSGGPLLPSVGASLLGAYSGCAGVLGCGGGLYGGGGCLLGPTFCGGAYAGCAAVANACAGCGFGFTCTTTCAASCSLNIATSTKTCLIFGVTFNC